MTKNVSMRSEDLNLIEHDGIPQSFRWNGHRYVVQRIVMHWVESGPWWQSISQSFFSGEFADADAGDVTWHIWRIEAQSMAGILVGVGTSFASGCTSGHGVCGLSRISPRSLVATLIFMATGIVTVFVVRHVLGA